MTSAKATTPRILVVYPFLPHYRRDVLRELDSMEDLSFEFASGIASPTNSMPLMDTSELRYHHQLHNIWVRNLLWQRGLLGLVARRRFDQVLFFASANYVSTWPAALLARLLQKRVVFWTIGWHRPDRGIKRVARGIFYRLSHQLLLYGHTAARIGITSGFSSNRMSVIYNSVSDPSDEPARFGPDGDVLDSALAYEGMLIGAVVRLNPAKMLDQVIHAAAALRDRGTDVAVLFVGDGPEHNALIGLAKSLNVPLFLPGAAYDKSTLVRAYEALDLTVIPGHAGLTTVQSLAHGTPVLTNDQAHTQAPESEAVIAGTTGDVFPLGDLVATADSIQHWLDRVRNDPSSVSSACKEEVAARWTSHAHAQRIAGALKMEQLT